MEEYLYFDEDDIDEDCYDDDYSIHDNDPWLDDNYLERDDEALWSMRRQEEEEQMAEYIKWLEKIREGFRLIVVKNIDIHWVQSCQTVELYNEEKNPWEDYLNQQEFDFIKECIKAILGQE